MKRFLKAVLPMACAIAATCCIALEWVLPYLGGRAGYHPSFFGLLHLELFAWAGAVLFGLCTLVAVTVAVSRRRNVITALLAVLLLVLAWAVPFLNLPRDPFMLGFHHRLFSRITPDQLRLAATTATPLLGAEDSFLPGPDKWPLWDESYRKKWTALAAVPGISNLDPNVAVFVRRGVFEMRWGGHALGYFGVRVHAPTVRRELEDTVFWATHPDIALFMTAH